VISVDIHSTEQRVVLTGRDVDCGMARIAQVHLEPLGVELAVFRDLQEAELWLGAEVGT
jgi:hypothetical protein